MAYVITQTCCNDASCVAVCPVDCIHPAPGEPGYATAEMLYIDPGSCIDCGVCVDPCPVDAIYADDELPDVLGRFEEINADYYRSVYGQVFPQPAAPRPPARTAPPGGPLRVAIVGAGPSGFYAAEQLLDKARVPVRISVFDRLPTPYGLVRAGVAPDHQNTKRVTESFDRIAAEPDVHSFLNVEIGTHLSHQELLAHHHAVIYTVGAPNDRHLGIPGEDLPGSHAATEFVAWYNGHPDYADRTFDLGHERAVIVGNGNVALDIARILLLDNDILARTDIAEHALAALAKSRISEVVLLGRRGPAQAAYTTPELLALGHLPGVDVLADPAELDADLPTAPGPENSPADYYARLKTRTAGELAAASSGADKRIVLRFLASPKEFLGADRVEGIRVVRNRLVPASDGRLVAEPTGETETLETGLVLRSIGYRGRALPGLPFDERSGTLPNDGGRVLDPGTGEPVRGVYTAGWIKRGPSGVIGTNKKCAAETIDALLDDYFADRLATPGSDTGELDALVARRRPDFVDHQRWRAIDERERADGRAANRPRVKLTDVDQMLAVSPTGSASDTAPRRRRGDLSAHANRRTR